MYPLHNWSQWPRGLRHERSSPASLLDHGFESHSRHRCLSTFILCLCKIATLWQADPPSKESYRLSKVKQAFHEYPTLQVGATGTKIKKKTPFIKNMLRQLCHKSVTSILEWRNCMLLIKNINSWPYCRSTWCRRIVTTKIWVPISFNLFSNVSHE
jgi:hypothetical protein